MGRLCTVCSSEHCADIDKAIVSGASYRAVAQRWGVSRDAVRRHALRHLSPALAAMRTQEQEDRRTSLLDRVEVLVQRAETLYTAAAGEGKSAQALAVLKELRGLLELYGKATGELKPDGPQVVLNLQASPEWLQLRGVIFAALMAYPEARQAVAGRLLELEAGDS